MCEGWVSAGLLTSFRATELRKGASQTAMARRPCLQIQTLGCRVLVNLVTEFYEERNQNYNLEDIKEKRNGNNPCNIAFQVVVAATLFFDVNALMN